MAVKKENKRTTVSKAELATLRRKAAYYDLVLSSKTVYSTTEIAASFGKSAQWLNKLLEEKKVIRKVNDLWFATAKYYDKGLFEQRTGVYTGKEMDVKTRIITGWTEAGREFVWELLSTEDKKDEQ